jgi:hypothetical protein
MTTNEPTGPADDDGAEDEDAATGDADDTGAELTADDAEVTAEDDMDVDPLALEPHDAPPVAAAPVPVAEVRKRAIAALAANIGVLLFCSPLFGLIGIVLAVIGLARVGSRPESARVFTRWAWIVCGVALLLFAILTVWTIVTVDEEAGLTLLRAARYA